MPLGTSVNVSSAWTVVHTTFYKEAVAQIIGLHQEFEIILCNYVWVRKNIVDISAFFRRTYLPRGCSQGVPGGHARACHLTLRSTKPQKIVQEYFIAHSHNTLWHNFQFCNIYVTTKWSWNEKFQSFSSCPPMKAMFICQTGMTNVVCLTSNFHEIIYGSLVHIYTVIFQENIVYFTT